MRNKVTAKLTTLSMWKLTIKYKTGQVMQYPLSGTEYFGTMVDALIMGDRLKDKGIALQAWTEAVTIKVWRM